MSGMQTIYFNSARNRALDIIDSPRKGAWISLEDPTREELMQFAQTYDLDIDLLDDAIDLYEAPRVEKDNGNVYIYTRYCYPEGIDIATEPVLLIYGPEYVISVSRRRTELFDRLASTGADQIITTQKTKMLLLMLAEINHSYRLQLNEVSKRILRFRSELRKADISNKEFVTIIELEEDLNEFLAALQPQATVLMLLTGGKYLPLFEDDKDIIEDLDLDVRELIEFTNSRLGALRSIRQVHDAIATNNLNRTFKRLTSIAIFLSVLTVIAGLWGMNVQVPFAESAYGFWIVSGIAATAMLVFTVFFYFKKWL